MGKLSHWMKRKLAMFSDSSSASSGSQCRYPSHLPSTEIADAKLLGDFKGQLKLSIYVNYGLLTVHVMMGRRLKSKCKSTCDSYVKLCLIPDEGRRTKCKTDVAFESNNPVYDEKFSFELLDEDITKRLSISVWHRDRLRNQCEFIGCMSFGMQHLQEQPINGWFQLLTGEVGRRKHYPIEDRKAVPFEQGRSNKMTSSRDMVSVEKHVVVIRRVGKSGFGFTITNRCPVEVRRIERDSPAALAGLKSGDCIIRVDGLNVSRSAGDAVARIIKHAQRKIVLEVERTRYIEPEPLADVYNLCPKTPSLDMSKLSNLSVSPWKQSLDRHYQPAPMETRDYGWLDYYDDMRTDSRVSSHSSSGASSYGYSCSSLPRSFQQYEDQPWMDYGWLDDKETYRRCSSVQSKKRVTFMDHV